MKSLGWNLSLKEPPFPPHTRSTSLPHRRRTIVEFNYQTTGEGEEEEGEVDFSLLDFSIRPPGFVVGATIRVGTKLLNMLTDKGRGGEG